MPWKENVAELNLEMNSRYYCIPDIHGMYKLLYQALHYIYTNNPNGGKIIFLGDYIDRGTENRKVLETVMNPPENWEFICLSGNHEEMLVDSWEGCHIEGTFALPYDKNVPLEWYSFGLIPANPIKFIPEEVIIWMKNLPIYHFEGNNIFVHAFYDGMIPPDQQDRDMILWNRYNDFEPFRSYADSLHLTHGHTPRLHGPVSSPNRTNLDIGSYTGQLAIAEYKTGITGPVDFRIFKS